MRPVKSGATYRRTIQQFAEKLLLQGHGSVYNRTMQALTSYNIGLRNICCPIDFVVTTLPVLPPYIYTNSLSSFLFHYQSKQFTSVETTFKNANFGFEQEF